MSIRLPFTPKAQLFLAWSFLIISTITYFILIYSQAALRYDTFKATAFDLGNMDQAIWNTLHGRWFQFTNHGSNWYGMPIRLGQHVEPIIIPLSLLYLIHADIHILLAFQTLVLALGTIPIFLLTRRFIPDWPLLAPPMVLAYLLAPALLGLNLYDFHPVSLATPLFLYAMLALTYRRLIWFTLCCILAAACKEEIPAIVAMLGLLVIWKYKMPRTGILMFIIGTTAFLLAFLVIEPHFNVGAQRNTFWYRYSALGSSPTNAIGNIILHPWIPFSLFFTIDRFYYIACLIRSAGFFALLAPEWLIPALPSLAINLLSSEPFQHSGVYQYNAAIIPFVTLASIHGLRRFIYLWYGWRSEFAQQECYEEKQTLIVPARKRGDQNKSITGNGKLSIVVQQWDKYIQNNWHVWINHPRLVHLYKTFTQRWAHIQKRFNARIVPLAMLAPVPRMSVICSTWIIVMLILNYIIAIPLLNIFWADHQPGLREQRVEQLLAMIPSNAPVSASGSLNPHLSQRQYITVFPELTVATMQPRVNIPVEYIIVDLTNISPEDKRRSTYFLVYLNNIQQTRQFSTVARADGVILLKRTH